MGDTTPINIAGVNPEGTRILTAGYSGVVRVWQAWPHKPDALSTAAQAYLTYLTLP